MKVPAIPPRGLMKHLPHFVLILMCFLVGRTPLPAQPSPPPTDQQIAGFKLPEGFEIQLVLSDPDIGQPMNLNFDARGRLWVTHSVEYPYPAQGEGVEQDRGQFAGGGDHPPRDKLSVVEICPSGRSASVTHFATGLNIPIGNVPLKDGSEAIAYAIPSIFQFTDHDGDGRSDAPVPLYSQFGNIDVHGNASSFTRWIDGWVYGCHGFSNRSTITDSNGRVTQLRSGNTYRFQTDGSHFQQFTWGQVNPFGITFDPLGNVFDADCHSKPVYQLLRGATYPHFGDLEPAIGFGPTMIDHAHGSTGICGPAYYAADHFPVEYRDNLFLCNPVTGRVHRDRLIQQGSTLLCDTQPDFISTEDAWFRPVDAIVGPDGALYIADFCNLIIGHYEAPLDHPDRDRTHGRVWRVVYKGESQSTLPPPQNLTKLTTPQLAERLSDPNLQVRTLVTNYLVDSRADEIAPLLGQVIGDPQSATVRAHGAWIAERLERLTDSQIESLSRDSDRIGRVHTLKILAERAKLTESQMSLVRRSLEDTDAFAQRAAADCLAQHLAIENVPALLAGWKNSETADTHLIHVIRMALRDHLQSSKFDAGQFRERLRSWQLPPEQQTLLLDIASISSGDKAAMVVLNGADSGTIHPDVLVRSALQIARSASPEFQRMLLNESPRWFAGQPQRQIEIITAMLDGLDEHDDSNLPESQELRQRLKLWTASIAGDMLADVISRKQAWTRLPVPAASQSKSPFGARHRGSTDGNTDAQFWDSITHGETLTGILRSPEFELPTEFSFWMCGHNGPPQSADTKWNQVRLILADSEQVIATMYPPRSDVAQRYMFDAGQHQGQTAFVEIVDQDAGDAYAWIGVGRFEPPVIGVDQSDNGEDLLRLVGRLGLHELVTTIHPLLTDSRQSYEVRVAAIDTLLMLDRTDAIVDSLGNVLSTTSNPVALRNQAAIALGKLGSTRSREFLQTMLLQTAAELQSQIAASLATDAEGIDALLNAIAAGKASPRLLQETPIARSIERLASREQTQRVEGLLREVPSVDAQTSAMLAKHRASMRDSIGEASLESGHQVFTKHCAVCHKIDTEGALVGPQLDGIGNRGMDRLLEDIIDPNRNVDAAFRTTIIVTNSGNVVTGLLRRQQAGKVILVDQTGKEIEIAEADIEEQQTSRISPMPSSFTQAIGDEGLRDLVAYLLGTRKE